MLCHHIVRCCLFFALRYFVLFILFISSIGFVWWCINFVLQVLIALSIQFGGKKCDVSMFSNRIKICVGLSNGFLLLFVDVVWQLLMYLKRLFRQCWVKGGWNFGTHFLKNLCGWKILCNVTWLLTVTTKA